jgi:hypothetical protein
MAVLIGIKRPGIILEESRHCLKLRFQTKTPPKAAKYRVTVYSNFSRRNYYQSRIQNPESRIQNPESRIQNPESRKALHSTPMFQVFILN